MFRPVVHPEEGQKPEEVFIWTSADYDPRLGPAGRHRLHLGLSLLPLLCWTSPTHSSSSPRKHWLDLRRIIDPDDTRFDDIEFARWESDGLLLRGCDTEDGRWKERSSANRAVEG